MIHILFRRPICAVLLAASLAGAGHAQTDGSLARIEEIVRQGPVDARPGPKASRRCFVALEDVLAGGQTPDIARLAQSLETICYSGFRSELERFGMLYLLEAAGHRTAPIQESPAPAPLTGLYAEVATCWNVGALSREAQLIRLTVSFEIGADGRPVAESIEMVETDGLPNASEQAFQAVRRAVLRCGDSGYGHPAGTYRVVFAP